MTQQSARSCDQPGDSSLPSTVNWPKAIVGVATWLRAPYKNHERLYEAILTLLGPTLTRGYKAVQAHPEGQRVLTDKPDLLALLSDTNYLRGLPHGSLGAAYHDFLSKHRLDAGVFGESESIRPIAEKNGWSGDFYYLLVRGTVLHDVFHTLGGYGPDPGGELGNIGFHIGNLGRAPAFRGLATALAVFMPMGGGGIRRRLRYLNEAIQRGRLADNLMAAYYEELLGLPIDEVRERLNIMPVRFAHPGGHVFSMWVPPGSNGVEAVPEPWVYPAVTAPHPLRSNI